MTSITAPAHGTIPGRRATFVAGPRTAPQITASGMALAAVVAGAGALAACAATLSLTFL